MKQGSNNKRPRRGGAPKGNRGPVRNQTFDSNCGGQRVRGTAQQVMEKYLALARDAASAGDRILAENYYQHAEHYFRIANVNGALSNRVQQPGQAAPQTPAHDRNPVDDLFDDEDEAALQHAGNSGYGDGPQRGEQRSGRGNGRDHDHDHDHDDRDDDSDQVAAHHGDDQGEGSDDREEDRQPRSRRQRNRRPARQADDADSAPAARQAEADQPAATAEAAPAEEGEQKPRRSRRKPPASEPEGGQDEGEDKPAPRRRRAPARKKASSDDGDDAGSDDRREAVA